MHAAEDGRKDLLSRGTCPCHEFTVFVFRMDPAVTDMEEQDHPVGPPDLPLLPLMETRHRPAGPFNFSGGGELSDEEVQRQASTSGVHLAALAFFSVPQVSILISHFYLPSNKILPHVLLRTDVIKNCSQVFATVIVTSLHWSDDADCASFDKWRFWAVVNSMRISANLFVNLILYYAVRSNWNVSKLRSILTTRGSLELGNTALMSVCVYVLTAMHSMRMQAVYFGLWWGTCGFSGTLRRMRAVILESRRSTFSAGHSWFAKIL